MHINCGCFFCLIGWGEWGAHPKATSDCLASTKTKDEEEKIGLKYTEAGKGLLYNQKQHQ